jgi:hypothetical protein
MFVLRIWYSAADENGRFLPRYILEDPFTRARRGFATLQELALYLEALRPSPPSQSPKSE